MANNKRRDPYRNFNFLTLVGGAVAGIAALGFVRKLFARLERRYPGVYVEEKPTGPRPIEGVGTSTAGRAGGPRKPARRPTRQGPRATTRRKR
jgi:hypothetical protein